MLGEWVGAGGGGEGGNVTSRFLGSERSTPVWSVFRWAGSLGLSLRSSFPSCLLSSMAVSAVARATFCAGFHL